MTDAIYAKAAVIKPPDDLAVMAFTRDIKPDVAQRAWRAVNEFRKMLPTIQSFVRAITRDPNVIVQITTGVPCTDGRTVWLRPPIQLGDYVEHQRGVCGERDENLQHLCPACTLRESILSTLFHECAHIVFDSFETISEEERARIIIRVLNERPGISGTRLEKLQRLIKEASERYIPSYVEVNDYISPYLPIIFNALEDARVNRAMYNSRAGTQVWFRASAIQVFEHGMELADGTIVKWSDMGANSQVIIGLFCRASGFETKGWFKDEIEEALNDRQLKTMVGSLRTARSAANVYRVGFPILERLRELGFCIRLGEPCDDPPPMPESGMEMPPSEGEQTEYASLGDSDDESLPEVTDDVILAPEDRMEPPPGKGGDDSDSEPDDPETGDTMPADASNDDDSADDADASDDAADDDLDGNKDDDKSGADDQPDDEADDELDELGDEPDDDDSDSGSGDSADVSDAESDDESGAGDGDEESDDSTESPDDVEAALAKFGGHAPSKPTAKEAEEEKAVDRAIVQAENFDAPSIGVLGVKVHKFGEMSERASKMGWNSARRTSSDDSYWDAPEALLGKALFKMRKVFAYNLASRQERNLRHGRVNGPDAHRTAYGDKKVFSRTRIPGRRKYKVTIGLDISGSTGGERIDIIKQAGMAMGELFNRTGVDFSMYAHTGAGIAVGGEHVGAGHAAANLMYADHFEIKGYGQPWGDKTCRALRALTSASMNLDGHHLEFYRKLTERQDATDRLIIYFTDGEMPCENYDDELVVLKREIETCRKRNIALLGVGIETDSPVRHGLDTVQIDTVDDIPKLIDEIESRLTKVRV